MSTTPITPYNLDAERAVLGACLISPDALNKAVDALTPSDFYNVDHRLIFSAIERTAAENKPVDIITLSEELKAQGIFNRIGGILRLSELVDNVHTTANNATYVEIIKQHALRRRMNEAGLAVADMAADPDKSITAILDEAERLIFNAASNKSEGKAHHVRDLIGPAIADLLSRSQNNDTSSITGYATGFADIDAILGGLQPGSLNVIAGRPSMGKTAFAMTIAQFGGGSMFNSPVLIFSLEMPADQIIKRMIAAESGVSLQALMRGTISADDFERARKACDTLCQQKIYINDSTSLTASEFRGRCRRFKMKHPDLALIVVDYLQLMCLNPDKRSESRNQEISDISRTIKAVARELECPVIALSQLSRNTENRSDRKPQLSDLRDSGAIEQDADTVMLLYREDYYGENENNSLTDSKADVRIAKNRNGGTGVVSLTFRREITRFFNHGEEP